VSEIDYMKNVFKNAQEKYKDIIDMEYSKSANRPQMSLHDRAAQFAPFAALTGHEEAIEETARLTEEKIILDEAAKEIIDRKLYEISQNIEKRWSVALTYFKADRLKSGGVYLTDVGVVKKIDEVAKVVIMDNGMRIEIDGIVGVEIGKAH
jgi:hypothetical protein